jgi:hypothetical protein
VVGPPVTLHSSPVFRLPKIDWGPEEDPIDYTDAWIVVLAILFLINLFSMVYH